MRIAQKPSGAKKGTTEKATELSLSVIQAARLVDDWLSHLGGKRLGPRGEADARTDNREIEPFLQSLWRVLNQA